MAERVAVVTGASRGIGKGIALELGAAGFTVYVTGRSVEAGPIPGTVGETAAQIDELGGRGVAVACDHYDDRGDDQDAGIALGCLIAEAPLSTMRPDLKRTNGESKYTRGDLKRTNG